MAKARRLAPAQVRALERVSRLPGIEEFYLAGGAAIAWHLGHRLSLDLDLFSRGDHAPFVSIQQATRRFRSMRVIEVNDFLLAMKVGQVRVDIVKYGYPLLERPAQGPHGFPIARLRDLAAMKLAAIAKRGVKRDFWDLYAIAQSGLSLREVTEAYVERFGHTEVDLYHVAVALTWFEDAEANPFKARGLTPALWKRIKRYFLEQAPLLLERPARARRR